MQPQYPPPPPPPPPIYSAPPPGSNRIPRPVIWGGAVLVAAVVLFGYREITQPSPKESFERALEGFLGAGLRDLAVSEQHHRGNQHGSAPDHGAGDSVRPRGWGRINRRRWWRRWRVLWLHGVAYSGRQYHASCLLFTSFRATPSAVPGSRPNSAKSAPATVAPRPPAPPPPARTVRVPCASRWRARHRPARASVW